MDDSPEIADAALAALPARRPTLRDGPDIARLAHELRTPLAAIAALAEIMRDERLGALADARYRGYAGDIHDSALHALGVLSSFLEPADARGKVLPMVFAEIDVAEVAAGSVSALAPLARRAGVRLVLDAEPRLPHLVADRRSLKQILLNLIANAVRFTPPRGRVRVGTRYHCGGAVSLEVADTGDGMSAAELRRVLAAGAASGAAAASRRNGGAGSGFGLPLVRALAAANGGSLEIESARGQGTRAIVRFAHDRVVPV
jgi:signal transduction histidine kinase